MIEQIRDEWVKVDRLGIDRFWLWLVKESDFFTAPASTQFHGAYPGGLAIHSMNVLKLLREKTTYFNMSFNMRSIIVVALGHDLCKLGCYKESDREPSSAQIKYLKDLMTKANKPFVFDNKLLAGHASKLIDWYVNKCVGDKPEQGPTYEFKDPFPVGHGEKSVFILQKYMELTEEEIAAIKWHMGPWDMPKDERTYRAAIDKYPLVTLTFTADLEASQILEA